MTQAIGGQGNGRPGPRSFTEIPDDLTCIHVGRLCALSAEQGERIASRSTKTRNRTRHGSRNVTGVEALRAVQSAYEAVFDDMEFKGLHERGMGDLGNPEGILCVTLGDNRVCGWSVQHGSAAERHQIRR